MKLYVSVIAIFLSTPLGGMAPSASGQPQPVQPPQTTAQTGSFQVNAAGQAQLIVHYTVPVKTVGVDGKVVDSVKKEDFIVNLGNLSTFSLSPKEIAQKVEDGLSQKFKNMSDQQLLTQTGLATFGRNGSKWALLLDDKPFESYAKETILVKDANKMKDIYSKGLNAKYTDDAPILNAATPIMPTQAPAPSEKPVEKPNTPEMQAAKPQQPNMQPSKV